MTITRPLPASTTVTSTTDHTTDLSRVRSRIGDGGGLDGAGKIYLTDERINDVIAELGGYSVAVCIRCVEMILADIARDSDFSAGSISTQRTQVTAQFEGVLARLRADAASETSAYVGGISVAEVARNNARTDLRPAVFSVGMDRYR
jgi:hypothetical protein